MFLRTPLLIALCASAAFAQLDLGTGGVSQAEVDGYLGPFYRVIASGLAQGRFSPGRSGFGFDAGFQAGVVPLPDSDPFRATTLSALPLFRVRAGARALGGAVMARGLVWKDPRVGDLAAFGAGAQYGLEFPVALPLRCDLALGWDRMQFTSEYTYKYRGSALGLFDQDVPGDYTLSEQVFGGALTVSARLGKWIPYARGGFDWASGRFRYLYLDPRDDKTHRVASDLGFPSGQGAIGLFWRGFRVEAALASFLALEAGWSLFL